MHDSKDQPAADVVLGGHGELQVLGGRIDGHGRRVCRRGPDEGKQPAAQSVRVAELTGRRVPLWRREVGHQTARQLDGSRGGTIEHAAQRAGVRARTRGATGAAGRSTLAGAAARGRGAAGGGRSRRATGSARRTTRGGGAARGRSARAGGAAVARGATVCRRSPSWRRPRRPCRQHPPRLPSRAWCRPFRGSCRPFQSSCRPFRGSCRPFRGSCRPFQSSCRRPQPSLRCQGFPPSRRAHRCPPAIRLRRPSPSRRGHRWTEFRRSPDPSQVRFPGPPCRDSRTRKAQRRAPRPSAMSATRSRRHHRVHAQTRGGHPKVFGRHSRHLDAIVTGH